MCCGLCRCPWTRSTFPPRPATTLVSNLFVFGCHSRCMIARWDFLRQRWPFQQIPLSLSLCWQAFCLPILPHSLLACILPVRFMDGVSDRNTSSTSQQRHEGNHFSTWINRCHPIRRNERKGTVGDAWGVTAIPDTSRADLYMVGRISYPGRWIAGESL